MRNQEVLRGAIFFSWFLPSFTRLGYRTRARFWPTSSYDFSGQHWLVTGASTGIGRAIALAAATAGATVHAVARSEDKLNALTKDVPAGAGIIVPHVRDLAEMSEVRALAADMQAKAERIDVLVNNVGLMLNAPQITQEGLDVGFATNVLGHYVLTEALCRNRHLNKNAAVINMSSGGMYNVALDTTALEQMEPYNGTLVYAHHKRAQVSLNRFWRQALGHHYNFYVMHPGWASTPGVETAMPEFHSGLNKLLRTPEEGADTALWLAAHRPDQSRSSGIWFDRKLRSEHFFTGTKQGQSVTALIEHLEKRSALNVTSLDLPEPAPQPSALRASQ